MVKVHIKHISLYKFNLQSKLFVLKQHHIVNPCIKILESTDDSDHQFAASGLAAINKNIVKISYFKHGSQKYFMFQHN